MGRLQQPLRMEKSSRLQRTGTKPKMLVHSGPYWNMESQAMKYIEMKSTVGGATAAVVDQATSTTVMPPFSPRNIEDYNFGRDEIHTKVTNVQPQLIASTAYIKTGNASGELDAWFIHIAEGVDDAVVSEFDILVQNNLQVGELVLIHGVPLGQQECRWPTVERRWCGRPSPTFFSTAKPPTSLLRRPQVFTLRSHPTGHPRF